MSGEADAEAEQPVPIRGIEWWQSSIWASLLHYRSALPKCARPVRILSMCSGTLGEVFIARAFGMPVQYEASDRKIASR
eukprot:4124866-Pyramimonas_sp.AAC.1